MCYKVELYNSTPVTLRRTGTHEKNVSVLVNNKKNKIFCLLPITKAQVEKRKSFPLGHLCLSLLTDNRADWDPEPLEPAPDPALLMSPFGDIPFGFGL